MLVDIMVFGGAKEGIVLTEAGMRIKELMTAQVDLPWSDIRSIDIRGTAILVNGYQVVDCPMVDKPELQRLFATVGEFVGQALSNGTPSAGRKASRAASNPAPWNDPVLSEEVYLAAKQHLVELSDVLEPVEREVGEGWVDRQALAKLLNCLVKRWATPARRIGVSVDR
ncbi:hypothetical protein JVX96_00600 [Variovorax sp. PDNC026]|uniref:hypothetical protein n=1 Tax=Variovorax sp. PDNC026 TaxID=2811425 RepID=UPI001964FF50|nr:hypothetical protein [Variovorax sp. PDNC026]QRY31862.1 hypothetical protein JVX96_00600 [Variovorax sp. PDNC026]